MPLSGYDAALSAIATTAASTPSCPSTSATPSGVAATLHTAHTAAFNSATAEFPADGAPFPGKSFSSENISRRLLSLKSSSSPASVAASIP